MNCIDGGFNMRFANQILNFKRERKGYDIL